MLRNENLGLKMEVSRAAHTHTVKTLFNFFIQPGLLYELIWYCLKV